MKKSLVIRAKTSLQAFYILALKTVFVSNVFSTIILYHSSFEFARGFISFFLQRRNVYVHFHGVYYVERWTQTLC